MSRVCVLVDMHMILLVALTMLNKVEGGFISARIIYNFGFGAKRHIPDAAVVVSARRAIASSKYGLIDTWFNYDNAFRESEKFTL